MLKDAGILYNTAYTWDQYDGELSLADMLADPIVQLMMAQDRVQPAFIIDIVKTAQRNLAGRSL